MSAPSLTDHYNDLIGEMDKTLSLVRGFWIESRDQFEQKKNMDRLNQLLDERLRLMRARDAAATLASGQAPAVDPFVKAVKVKGTKGDKGGKAT